MEGLDWRLVVKQQHYFCNRFHHPVVPPVQVGSSALSHVKCSYCGLSLFDCELCCALAHINIPAAASYSTSVLYSLIGNRWVYVPTGRAEVWSPEGENT